MRSLLVLFVSLGVVACGKPKGDLFAVLVAGSSGYDNYRHEADVFHAYQVLVQHGVKAANIITFAYDDIARNEDNPFPNQVFNKPNGTDVYAGVQIDYSGDDVTSDNFMAVLKGDKSGVSGGNGRVLESTSADRVFVYFADHGGVGLIAFPWDELTADDLNTTLVQMHANGKYSELLFYLEACESGSMFAGVLPDNINILAVTAANESQASFAFYCDDPILHTCLADAFSAHWLEDSDAEDLTAETLEQQYEAVKKLTDLSEVTTYGNLSILNEFVGNFQGLSKKKTRAHSLRKVSKATTERPLEQWASRDIPLKTLESKLRHAKTAAKREQFARELETMRQKRSFHDEHTRALVGRLVADAAIREHVLTHRPAAVADLKCHHRVVKAYSKACFNLGRNSYALNAAAPLTNLCDLGVGADRIVKTIAAHCSHKDADMTHIN